MKTLSKLAKQLEALGDRQGVYKGLLAGALCLGVSQTAFALGGDTTLCTAPDNTYVVTNTADSGPGSLREAVALANGDNAKSKIIFDPIGVATSIVPTTVDGNLFGIVTNPTAYIINKPVCMDGLEGRTTRAEINGSAFFGVGVHALGLDGNEGTGASGSIIKGMRISIVPRNFATSTGGVGIIGSGGDYTIDNNVFTDNFFSGINGTYSVDLSDLSGGNTLISNNTIGAEFIFGGFLSLVWGGASGTVIKGNTISDGLFNGIIANFGFDATVEDNTVSRSGTGIRIGNMTNCLVKDNTVRDSEDVLDPGFPAVGIYLASGSNGCLVTGNTVTGTTVIPGLLDFGLYTSAILVDNTGRVTPDIIPIPDSLPARDNAVLSNSIYDNDGLGIDLLESADETGFCVDAGIFEFINFLGFGFGCPGVTLNDVLDADISAPLNSGNNDGPNNLQNFPVLTEARLDGDELEVAGTLNSEAKKHYLVQFFTNTTPDPSGHGEGENFVGEIIVRTNAMGDAFFEFDDDDLAIPSDHTHVTATATELQVDSLLGDDDDDDSDSDDDDDDDDEAAITAYLSTSEFSAAVEIVVVNEDDDSDE